MHYFAELRRAMAVLASHPRAIFLGQAVAHLGTGMTASFDGVPKTKLLELPVFENVQLGMSIGLALDGWLPVSVFPRWNFLICACDQLVNHLDKLPLYSGFRPQVIVRVAVPTPEPLDPGPQHLGNFSDAFRQMCKTVRIVELTDAGMIVPAYKEAAARAGATILVEFTEKYNYGTRD